MYFQTTWASDGQVLTCRSGIAKTFGDSSYGPKLKATSATAERFVGKKHWVVVGHYVRSIPFRPAATEEPPGRHEPRHCPGSLPADQRSEECGGRTLTLVNMRTSLASRDGSQKNHPTAQLMQQKGYSPAKTTITGTACPEREWSRLDPCSGNGELIHSTEFHADLLCQTGSRFGMLRAEHKS